ncbi:MAG: response regulator transcription factor [Acidobacteria bacterium]|nr:response regulator transcription factor [Acidobacteriota bacterium]
MTLLIVEDNEGIRRLLRSVVADVADVVWDCCDGAGALDAFLMYRPDIVLMDIRMPGMDGLAATRQILLSDPTAKVVIVTDYDDDDLRVAARQAGACGYALKRNLLDLVPLIRSTASTENTETL